MANEYILYADESAKKGKYYSNFYGGACVLSKNLQPVQDVLTQKKAELGFTGEVKWSKVSSQYLDRYVSLMETFFDLVSQGLVKVRIMFTQNIHVPTGLTREQTDNQYFLLYYQFIKHAFGLRYSNPSRQHMKCRMYLDKLPDTKEKVSIFKGYLSSLSQSMPFREAGLTILKEDIADVDSHDHVILQCLDIVLGGIQFRLNDHHKDVPAGQRRRGKKTLAKEKLYKVMGSRIRQMHANFNVGISTGLNGDASNLWKHPYRHWRFVPAEHRLDTSRAKP